jgi:filamentous hemagglutinin family protein
MTPNQSRSLLPNLLGLCLLWLQSFSTIALGQITPDQSLGAESSTVRSNVEVRGGLADRIEGGAVRANNLFHSFSDFNVLANQRAYFSSPEGIQNILTRVTGSNASLIFGTLGVDGLANLFLMNPNGVVFGPNARLDVQGAFSASTGTAFSLGSQSFDAKNPNAAPLVTVNIPIGIQFAADAPARLRNEGELRADRGLTLAAGSVDSVGSLVSSQGAVTVEAVTGDARVDALRAQSAIVSARGNVVSQDSQLQTTGNLTLQAGDTVRIRDSVAKPVVVNAGGDLVIQGNHNVDILALNHAGTPFQAGGKLTLVSDGAISGDSHFASGGNFSILTQSGNAGQFVSLYDPIIRSSGDVSFGNYNGTSLLVESAGSISATTITITGPDAAAANINANPTDVDTLKNRSALILRSGLTPLTTATANVTPPPPPDPGNRTVMEGGTTFSSPAAAGVPNILVTGEIKTEGGAAGVVDISTTNGSIKLDGAVTAHEQGGNAGRITLNAGRDVTVNDLTAQGTGTINLTSTGGAIEFNGANVNANGGVTTISANTVAIQAAGTSFNGTVNFNRGTVGGGTITGSANSDIFNFNAGSTINTNVNGEVGADFFNFNGATITETSTLSGGDAIDTFTLNSGSIAADLQGNAGNDVFNLGTATFTATASIDGGDNENRVVGTNAAENFLVSGDRAGTIAGVTVSSIDIFEGGNGGIDTVTGTGGNDGFTIVGGNAANLNNIAFSQVEALAGGTGNDTFTFNNGVTFAGTIAGGGGDTDRLDYSSFTTDPQSNLQNLGGTGIEEVQGRNTGTSTLIGPNVENTWTLDGTIANRGTLVNVPNGTITFIDFNRLVGGTNVDTFTLTDGGRLSQILGGESGDIFNINGGVVGNLFGDGGDDTFNFAAGRILGGAIDGGADTDTLNYSAYTTNITVDFQTPASTTGVTGFSGIDAVVGGSGTGDTVAGDDNGNVFTIANNGTEAFDGVRLVGIENIDGRGGDDRFRFNAGASIAGTVTGGGGGADRLDYSLYTTAIDVNLTTNTATGVTGFSGIEAVTGGTSLPVNDTLVGTNAPETFSADGGTAGSFQFQNIETLDGGGGGDTLEGTGVNDIFAIEVVGGNQGTLNTTTFRNFATLKGQGGNDNFNFNSGNFTGTVEGNNDNDTFSFNGGTISNPATGDAIVGGSGDNNTVQGQDLAADTFVITGNNQGTANGVRFSQIQRLEGRGGSDSFSLAPGTTLTQTIVADGGGGGGTDSITGTDAPETFGLGNLAIPGLQLVSIETLNGGGGEDTLQGTGGQDTFEVNGTNAGFGCASAVCTAVNRINFSNIEILDGAGGNDIFSFLAGANITTATGGAGNDAFTIASSLLSGTVTGGINDDTFNFTGITNATVFGNEGNDIFNFNGLSALGTIQGDSGNDIFNFNSGNTSGVLRGNAGDDRFNFNAGSTVSSVSVEGDAPIAAADDGNDTFTLNGGIVTSILKGGGGTENQIEGLDGTFGFDIFNLSASGQGTVNGINFSQVQTLAGRGGIDWFILQPNTTFSGMNLQGDAGNDLFFLNDGAVLTGSTANGGVGTDTLDYSSFTTDPNVNLASLVVGGIETIQGRATGLSSINGPNSDTTWAITGNRSGTVGGIRFVGFNNLLGGTADDDFRVADGAALNGSINGGGGSNNRLSYSGAPVVPNYTTPVFVDLQNRTATGINQFDNIQSVRGGDSSSDQISGTDADETFSFSGTGSVSGISSFEVIDGRGGNDTFILNAGGTATSLIGGAGNDTFVLNAGGTATSLIGGAGNDTVSLNGGRITGSIQGGSDVLTIEGDTLAGLPSAAGSITGSGSDSSIVIQPINPSAAIGINTTTGSGFEITPSFFPLVNDETATRFRDMTIGRIDGTGAVTVSSSSTNPFNLEIDTTIRGGSIEATGNTGINTRGNDLTLIANTGDINTSQNVIMSNFDPNFTPDFDAGSIRLTANQGSVSTRGILAQAYGLGNGGDITLQGNSVNVTLKPGDTIDTYSEGDGSTGNTRITAETGDVTITGQGSSVDTNRRWANKIWADRREAGISNSSKGNISIKSSTGNITVTGAEFNLLIGNQSTLSDTQVAEGGGKLTLDAPQGQVRLNDSRIFTGTEANSKGNGANVEILSNNFSLEGNSIVESTVKGSGQGGNISVQSQSINITPGSSIQATVLSSGNAGTISLKGNNTVQIQGTTIETTVEAGATGNGGSVQIQGGTVTLEGTTVTADTAGAGSAGSVTIAGNRLTLDASTNLTANTTGTGQAGNIKLLGSGPGSVGAPSLAINGSTLSSNIGAGATGAGGSINLEGTAIALNNNATITATNNGSNTGSSVTIGTNDTTSTTLTDTTISTTAANTTTNTASIGNVTVLGQSIALTGSTTINAENQGAAKAGTVQIGGATTGPLTLTQTGGTSLISTQVIGSGSGSNVALNGAAITLTGQGTGTGTGTSNAIIDATSSSGNASSQGGSVSLTATSGNLQLQNGAEIKTTTNGAAQGGNISLSATGTATLTNQSQLNATSTSTGKGGSVTITAANLALTQASAINTTTSGSGEGGNIALSSTGNTTLADQSQLNATSTGSGKGGSVTIQSSNLALTQASAINTTTSGSGEGGNVTLNATGQISLKDASKVNATTSGSGSAGDVSVTANSLTLQGNLTAGLPTDPPRNSAEQPNDNRSEIITRAGGTSTGAAGNITINANSVSLDYAALLADTRQRANRTQGNITITGAGSGNLTLNNESLVSAIGSGGVRGGNITVEGFGLIQGGPVTGPNGSDFTTNADDAGQGGVILFKGAPINFRRQKSVPGNASNDISSSGQIQLQDPGLEKGLKTLDVVFVDPNQLVGQDCQQAIDKPEGSSRFSIAGRGGVAPNPTAPLAAEAEDSDWVSVHKSGQTKPTEVNAQASTPVNTQVSTQAPSPAKLVPFKDRQCISSLWTTLYRH